jgi:thiol:disulfide interchange protein DsbC
MVSDLETKGVTMRFLPAILLFAAFLLIGGAPAPHAYQKEAGPARECSECHQMSKEEAGKLLGKFVERIVDIVPGPFPGTWEVDVIKGGKTYPLYLDYSGKYLFNGQVIRLGDMENLTGLRFIDLNRVDISSIPLADAVILGNPEAKKKVIVFDDPDCPWCRKLHGEIKQVVARDPEVAFFIRVYSRNNNPKSVEKARAIVCGKKDSAILLEDAFAGKKLPAAKCETKAVEETASLARKLGITGTPAMVMPDGRVISGYMQADALQKLLQEKK